MNVLEKKTSKLFYLVRCASSYRLEIKRKRNKARTNAFMPHTETLKPLTPVPRK